MKNYKMIIEYDGRRYSGWEEKEGRDTIQGKIQAVLSEICKTPVKVTGAGRTDAGVHARGMVANAHMELSQGPKEIRDYLNRYLPEDICVTEVCEVPERFHARYNAVGKTYCYTCYSGDVKTVFDRKYVYSIGFQPDIAAMRKAAEYLIGEKDFAAFCGNAKMKKSTVRRIDSIEIVRKDAYITFTYHGNGFLQYQIRIMTGTLLEVGKGNCRPERITDILLSKTRENAGPTLPPQGLCLMKIDY